MTPENPASATVNKEFFIGEIFISDFNFQPGGQVLQMLKEGGVGPIFGHAKPFRIDANALYENGPRKSKPIIRGGFFMTGMGCP
jgi:hypothetical protein